MSAPLDGLLEVGRIGRAHGVRGALHVVLSTDRAERVAPGAELHDGSRWWTVASARAQPGSRWVVQFDGLDDRAEAERLTGRTLYAAPISDADALWVHELIGTTVIDRSGTVRGTCVAVVDNPAHDLLELDSGHLVPVTFVDRVEDGVVHLEDPEGLFDLLDEP